MMKQNYVRPAGCDDIISSAVDSPLRSKLARLKDAGRKPDQILAFTGAKPGDRIGEVCSGSGYFTTMLSLIVGAEGQIFAHNTPGAVRRRKGNPTKKLIEKIGLTNVTPIENPMDEIDFPAGLDLIFSSNTYHDAVWTGMNRDKMNRRFYERLKDGGVFVLIDHQAMAGVGTAHAKTYHRIEKAVAVQEVCAAGFSLVEQADILNFADDPLDVDVHEKEVRLKTNRFVLKFQK